MKGRGELLQEIGKWASSMFDEVGGALSAALKQVRESKIKKRKENRCYYLINKKTRTYPPVTGASGGKLRYSVREALKERRTGQAGEKE